MLQHRLPPRACVGLTRYAPTVPWASMRAHSEIKNILIFEKHDGFLERLSSSRMSPSLRLSESRCCFFTCILACVPTALREIETHGRVAAGASSGLHSRCSSAPILRGQQTACLSSGGYRTRIQTPRGLAARLRLHISLPRRRREPRELPEGLRRRHTNTTAAGTDVEAHAFRTAGGPGRRASRRRSRSVPSCNSPSAGLSRSFKHNGCCVSARPPPRAALEHVHGSTPVSSGTSNNNTTS